MIFKKRYRFVLRALVLTIYVFQIQDLSGQTIKKETIAEMRGQAVKIEADESMLITD